MDYEIRVAMQLYENKLASFWQIDGQLSECDDDDRAYKLETRQRNLEKEVDQARDKLVALVEKLEKRNADLSWERNPDRSGGQFTQEEIEESRRGGHGW